MMAVEVRSDLSLCQWFLWLQVPVFLLLQDLNRSPTILLHHLTTQEKTLFGFAALLMNNNPGIVFDAWDLVDKLTSSIQISRSMFDKISVGQEPTVVGLYGERT